MIERLKTNFRLHTSAHFKPFCVTATGTCFLYLHYFVLITAFPMSVPVDLRGFACYTSFSSKYEKLTAAAEIPFAAFRFSGPSVLRSRNISFTVSKGRRRGHPKNREQERR
jgi:hypothetical protein